MPDDSTIAPVRATPKPMTRSGPTLVEPEIDHAARNALLKIEGMALDLQGLLNIAIARNVEPYQQDIAVSSARNLASLIGVTCLAATSESIPSSVSLWLLGGQA